MKEKVERLPPRETTLRQLFVYSGNQCAIHECDEKIVDEDGNYIAQVCHIEAASEGGQRFNPTMTNEERREFSNLILLCYKHHKATDDTHKYPVEVLKKIKKTHEDKFKNILADMSRPFIEDTTKLQIATYPKTLKSINEILEWRNSTEELNEMIVSAQEEIDKLKSIASSTRSVFLHMLESSDDNQCFLDEVQENLQLPNWEMSKYVGILQKNKLIYEPEENYDYSGHNIDFVDNNEWKIWGDIKKYCDKKPEDLHSVVYDMNFHLLD